MEQRGDSASSAGYVHDRGREDQERLVRIADQVARFAREACYYTDLKPGGAVIDIGCGPLGALAVLADAVGPTGTVVGLDASAEALEHARTVLAGRSHTDVRLVLGDINVIEPEAVAPPALFDLAYCRFVLMHQTDPASTLKRIAGLVRSGGRVVVQDHTDDPRYPLFDPPVPAAARIFTLHHENRRRRGQATDVPYRYADLCAAAGLRLIDQRGFFAIIDPDEELEIIGAVLGSLRQSLIAGGLTTEAEVEGLLQELDAARTDGRRMATTPLLVEMIAEVP